ncbi:MAG: hypothetical protein WA979_09315 [Pacificimonas sp.]
MMRRFLPVAAALSLSACNMAGAPVADGEATGETPIAPAETETESSDGALIPGSVQGTWREVALDAENVASAECEPSKTANFGKIWTIRADGFTRFETGGRLIEVHERDASRMDATYDTTYADTPTTDRYIFDAKDDGRTLILRETGADARPGPIRMLRCPS